MSSDGVRMGVVVGVLLFVPLLVVLLTSGSETVVRPEPAGEPTPVPETPTLGASPTSSPPPVEIDPTELPPVAGCAPEAALDRDRRRAAFRDGLAAERDGEGLSPGSRQWLDELARQLDTCLGRLTADHADLRAAARRALDAAHAYEAAVAAPSEHSVSAAWGDLEDAVDATVDTWASATQ